MMLQQLRSAASSEPIVHEVVGRISLQSKVAAGHQQLVIVITTSSPTILLSLPFFCRPRGSRSETDLAQLGPQQSFSQSLSDFETKHFLTRSRIQQLNML